jgi:hypothetical protein
MLVAPQKAGARRSLGPAERQNQLPLRPIWCTVFALFPSRRAFFVEFAAVDR